MVAAHETVAEAKGGIIPNRNGRIALREVIVAAMSCRVAGVSSERALRHQRRNGRH